MNILFYPLLIILAFDKPTSRCSYAAPNAFNVLIPVSVNADELAFIGEVKGRSYIKVVLHPVKSLSSTDVNEIDATLNYRGSYYESVSGKKYVLTASFTPQSREWTFRCFNPNNQAVYFFKGKQKPDGSIEGTWKSSHSTHAFYLRPS